MIIVCPAFIILRFFVIGQNLTVTPSFDPEFSPSVVITRIGAAVDHGVDRTRSAKQFTARPENFPPMHMRLLLCLIGPITLGFEKLWESRRDMNLLFFVRSAGFEQDYFYSRVLC